jgi:tRNA(Ile)-lysidine synthase
MLDKLRKTLIHECELAIDKPVLIGVSGGPDSLGLLDALRQLGYRVIMAHLNHKLRPEATSEALRLTDYKQMNILIVHSEVPVPEYAKTHALSIEEVARVPI